MFAKVAERKLRGNEVFFFDPQVLVILDIL